MTHMPTQGNTERVTALRASLHILVVEDDASCAFVMKHFLELNGYQFDLASTGAEAMQKAAANAYDVILMDVKMPDMTGFEATRRIRDFEQTSGQTAARVVGVTACAFTADRSDCLSSGMDDYISKPIDFPRLEDCLRALRQRYNARKACQLSVVPRDLPDRSTT